MTEALFRVVTGLVGGGRGRSAMERMKEHIAEAMDGGAFGIAS